MVLAIDIGNTRSKLGVFKAHTLNQLVIWENGWTSKELDTFLHTHTIKKVIYSSVNQLEKDVQTYFKTIQAVELTSTTVLPIKNNYQTPQTLGKDRLAAVLGAYQEFPKQACLIIDAGTCVTYDILTAEGTYIGGNIAPGLKMRFKAMHHFTARLPLVEAADLDNTIGISTQTALQNGGQLGLLFEIEGYIKHCENHLQTQINVILTGGDAIFLANRLKNKIFVRPNLVLQGLNALINYSKGV